MNQSLGRFFSGFLPLFLCHRFHSIISPHSSHSFHTRSYNGVSILVGRYHCYSQTFKYRGFIISHPSAQSYVGRKLNYYKALSEGCLLFCNELIIKLLGNQCKYKSCKNSLYNFLMVHTFFDMLTALAQMVACLPLVQWVRG